MLKNSEQVSEKVKSIREAQDRKEIGISYFNSLNAAIALVGNHIHIDNPERIKEVVIYWRDFFLEEHATYREKALAQFTANIVEGGTAIERLQKADSLVSLKAVWVTLTEDERRNENIINVCKQMRAKYENIS